MKATGNFPFSIREAIVNKLGKNIIWSLEKFISRHSLVANTPFLNKSEFPWVENLENDWQAIRKELDVILNYADNLPRFQDISPDQGRNVSKDDLWKTFFLYGYGVKMEENCTYCPETTRIIENIPGVKTAFFSILLPGKHIPEHRGPYNGVLRCHLALKVPQDRNKCGIRVDNETYYWAEGEAVIFDDSFNHEAWNNTNETRVVLFLDVMRPMSSPAVFLNHLIINLIRISPFIQDARKNQQKWDKTFAEIFKN